jgi:hypothetical protein
MKDNERKEISDYIDRFEGVSPESILDYIGRLTDFLINNMTLEGRKFFEEYRLKEMMGGFYQPPVEIKKSDHYDLVSSTNPPKSDNNY